MLNSRAKKFKKKYQTDFLRLISEEVKKSESCTILAMPGGGKSDIISHLTTQEFLDIYKIRNKSIIIEIDLNNLLEIEPLNFYRYFYKKLAKRLMSDKKVDKETKEQLAASYKDTLMVLDSFILFEEIKDIIKSSTDSGYNFVFVFDHLLSIIDIGATIFNNLKAIRNINKEQVAIFFVGNINLDLVLTPANMGSLFSLFNFKKLYLPPLTFNDASLIIDEFEQLYSSNISPEIREKIHKLSGGNIWYIKSLCKAHSEKGDCIFEMNGVDLVESLFKIEEVKTTNSNLWNKFLDDDQLVISNLVSNPDSLNPPNDFLEQTGVIRKNGELRLFSPIFEEFVKSILPNTSGTTKNIKNIFSVNTAKQQILKDNKILQINFTRSEYRVLSLLIQNPNSVLTRDDIAKAMWGNDFYEKYSDYAIDKLISRIRKKLEDDTTAPKYLQTIKGVGFKFIS